MMESTVQLGIGHYTIQMSVTMGYQKVLFHWISCLPTGEHKTTHMDVLSQLFQ
jgi:hypothetical protein